MAKAIFLCLLDQQRQLTIHWGKDHGKEMITVGDDILRKAKGNPRDQRSTRATTSSRTPRRLGP
eukprot:7156167-Alexandrium_andersonii.AAC.1